MRNPDRETVFRFKQFAVVNRRSAMKVGTDGVLLGAWVSSPSLSPSHSPSLSPELSPLKILDVGCGTGLISLMMAQRFPSAEITGVDIDADSVNEAIENVASSPWSSRIEILQGDVNDESLLANQIFDLIVSNPPFFTNGMLAPDQARQQARHESTLTLENLLAVASRHLSTTGRLALILPADRYDHLLSVITKYGFSITRICLVSTVPTKPPRRMMAELCYRPVDQQDTAPIEAEHMAISDSKGNFTPEYIALTKNFYLKF